jgi:hypothetical protein
MSNVTYSPNHRQAGTPMINILSTLRTATNLCKNVLLAELFGINGNSYKISTPSDTSMFAYTHILQNTEMVVGQ